ncbi:MAG: aminotransferase class I/II-fold pyridoxal phosphate-dependent enzyme [Clostridia bacterium]|nr:aminotransferase class I/II-fold pyridoxal phosphate-dependent enzyme [Clostridia bacterium]MBR5044817.1 aminotransferase class I/II-fold pyridoxal phosphate-dependent enzyme [Clostridia bacterium]
MQYSEMNRQELLSEKKRLSEQFEAYREKGLKLDLSRGKPAADQLDLSTDLLNRPIAPDEYTVDGFDCRNYGCPWGLPSMRRFFGDLLGIPAEQIIVGGNSSLALMYGTIARGMIFGLADSPAPWASEPNRKWLCPAPGYDRHFAVTEKMGFELIPVDMTAEGPDMDQVEKLALDPTVKGVWCVPKYANPTGITYSDATCRRLASMKTGAPDFTVMWDNAYAVHDLADKGDELANIFDLAKEYGTENRFICFTSTSKITFPGAGVSMMAASPANLDAAKKVLAVETIGYDKLNQLRHLKFLRDAAGVKAQMARHKALLAGKFRILEETLSRDLGGLGIAEWTHPKGGYFVSLDLPDGCAKRTYELAKEAGVALTPAGATFPYGRDPRDRNLRLAPTCSSTGDLAVAASILTVAARLAVLEKML